MLIGLALAGCASVPEARLTAERPRLFVRATPGPGRLSLVELRRRASETPFRERQRSLRTTIANLAMKWMMLGDEAAAGEALALMRRWQRPVRDSGDGVELIDLALGYDWLYAWPGFGAADKRTVEAAMVKAAQEMTGLLAGEGAHVFHTRMYAWTAAVGVTGLALHDTHPEGRRLFDFARDYYERRLLPARRLQGGAMHNGFLYGMNAMMLPLLQFLEAAKSAAGIDWFHTPNPADSDWLREMPLFLIHGIRPDLRTVKYADLTTDTPDKHFRFALDIFAAEYGDGHAAALARLLSERYKTSGYHAEYIYLFFAFHDPTVKPQPFDDLPRFCVFSTNGVGHAFFRSDWSTNATCVHVRCGDYFDDHGHFDQGSFAIFRHQALALKSGFYEFGSEHRLHWYKQAISANTVIFSDPADPQDEGRQRNMHFQDANTVADYEKHRARGHRVETGNITAVDDPRVMRCDRPDFHFVALDVTPAWDEAKVRRHRRYVGLLDGRHVIVVDDTATARPTIRARWLLHTAVEPAREGEGWAVRQPGAALFVQPLLPTAPQIWVIGGPGRECEVNGVNYSYLQTRKYRSYYKGPDADRPKPDLGLWRMELEHRAPAEQRLFVTLLTAGDPEDRPPAAGAVREGERLRIFVGEACVTLSLETR